MGTWGHGIFEDDFAMDVREDLLQRLAAGGPDDLVTTEMIDAYGPLDVDEEPTFWLGLAATQFEYGRLDPRGKAEAIRIIDAGSDLTRWNGDPERRRVLERLRKQLTGPPRKARRVTLAKAPRLHQGDVFRFPIDDRYGLGRVLIPEDGYYAFYRSTFERGDVPVDGIASHPVAFVVRCNDEGFRKRRWRVVGNRPLEQHLTRPIHFFHQAVGDPYCRVFDIWDRTGAENVVPAAECVGIERWGAFSEIHVMERLKALLAGEPDPWLLHEGPKIHPTR